MKKTILGLSILAAQLMAQPLFAQVSPLKGQMSTDLTHAEGIELWKSMKTNFENKSECYNRAQVWTYDANLKFGYEAKKILIHYSYKYNKEISSKWGFHIAPVYLTEGTDKVYDRGFSNFVHTPLSTKMWEEKFLDAGTQELTKLRIKLSGKIKKLQSSTKDLDRYDEYDMAKIISNREKIAEHRAKLVEFKITDQDLKKQKPIKLERLNVWIDFYNKEIERLRNNPSLKRSLKIELRLKRELLTKVKSDLNYAVHIQCKKITHIEELDLKKTDDWCYTQEVNQYYWGIPQLRLLNYGVDSYSDIPSSSGLPAAHREGARYQREDFKMNQTWAARKQAYGDKYKTMWKKEYELYEASKDAVSDIWNLSKDATSNTKAATKLIKKIEKASKGYAQLSKTVTAAKKKAAEVSTIASEVRRLKDIIYAISQSVIVKDTQTKVTSFNTAKNFLNKSDQKLKNLKRTLTFTKEKARQIQRDK